MDAIVGVWITSVLGAAAFSAAGYVLGHSQKPGPKAVVLPPAAIKAASVPPAPPSSKKPSLPKMAAVTTPSVAPKSVPPAKAASVAPAPSIPPPPETKRVDVSRPPDGGPRQHEDKSLVMPAHPDKPTQPKIPTAFPPPALKDGDIVEDRPTVMPDMATAEAILQSSVVTIPPPQRAPSMGVPSSFGMVDQNAMRAMIQDALAQVEQAAEQTKALEILKNELERQLEAARNEVRNEIVQRASAEARAEELSDRLARASEEAASLRHRVSMLDRQTKLLRESLKGPRPSAAETRKRELDEAEEMRAKLRDVVDKLERASMPPPSGSGISGEVAATRVSAPPDSLSRPFPGAPGLPRSLHPSAEDAIVLREEIARLAQENRTLRAQTLGSFPPKKPSRDSVPEIDIELYQSVMDQLHGIAGLTCAVLTDDSGAAIIGHGELAENLAAFGAYIRDASTRTERLLPLDGVDMVDIRDKAGMRLSTRVVLQNTQLSIVLLAKADAAVVAAKKVIADALRLEA